MKVITIQQPWASLIIQGHKKIETRSWNTKYRGELLIHASAKKIRLQDGMYDLIDHMQRIGFMDKYNELPYGAIIGKVNLVDTITTNKHEVGEENKICTPAFFFADYGDFLQITEQEKAFGDYSENRFGWLFSEPVMFENPLPIKGQLGLWNLPLELIATARVEKEKSIARNMTLELVKEVYMCNDLHRLVTIWNEIASNKYNLSLTEIRKANNSIREQILKSTATESDRLKYSNMLRDAMPQFCNQFKIKVRI